jgi:hypothetical protein
LESERTSAFKSTIEPCSQRNALDVEKSRDKDMPTTCDFELMKTASQVGVAHGDPVHDGAVAPQKRVL